MSLSRSERMLGARPGRPDCRSWKRRVPPSRSRTTSSVQRSPTSSSVRATGHRCPYSFFGMPQCRPALTAMQVTINLQVMTATVATAPFAARTRRLLEAPVTSTLLALAAPNALVMVLQAVVTTLDAVFVGWLGPAALAGVSLVFPLVMLMQTMSAGGMGGGVASAVARALGAGRRAEAQALAGHAVVIALAMSALFTGGLLLGGPAVYRAIGGTGEALEAAIT